MHVVCFNFVGNRSLHTTLVLTYYFINMVRCIALAYHGLTLLDSHCTGSTGSIKLLFSTRTFIWQGLRHY